MKVDRVAVVVFRLLGTVCRSSGGPLGRARRRRHVRVLRIPGDVSAGRWRSHFTDLLVVHHSERKSRLGPQILPKFWRAVRARKL